MAAQGRLAGCRLLAATEALLALAHPVLGHFDARKRGAGLLAYDDLIAHRRARAARSRQRLGAVQARWRPRPRAAGRGAGQQPGAVAHRRRADGGVLRRRGRGAPHDLSEAEAARRRSVFAVGDIKQSIYGFQGADAAGFGSWGTAFEERVRGSEGEFRKVPLTTSFRSTAPVLALVDAVFAEAPARQGVVPEGEDAAAPRRPRGPRRRGGAVAAAAPRRQAEAAPLAGAGAAGAGGRRAGAARRGRRRAHRPHAATTSACPRAASAAATPRPAARPWSPAASAPATCWCWSAAAPPSCSGWCAR